MKYCLKRGANISVRKALKNAPSESIKTGYK